MNDPLIGQQLSNYRIDAVIGRGGMATVYYGWDVNLHRPAAVKVIDARYRHNPTYAERFLQEARAVATWRHDNILQVYYAAQEEELYYFAMEYVDGPDLGQVMKQYADKKELMPHADVLEIGRAVADALDYAHKQGIIHRDVKPSNVMVAKNGRIALADFGLALDAQQGSFGGTFGTPHYIAPEQARNSATAVPQSDLYALGVILYEMLTGVVPFDDPSPTSLAVQHLTQPPPPPRQLNPNLNTTTEKMLLKALNKQPADRYQTGAALMEALAAALSAPETAGDVVTLPPLPGVVLPSASAPPPAAASPPPLSQMSVAERVSLYMPPPPPAVQKAATPTPLPAPPPSLAPAAAGKSFPAARLLGVGVVILSLLGAGWLLFGRDTVAATAVAATASASAAPPATVAAMLPATLPPTEPASPEVAADTAVPPTPGTAADTPSPTTAAALPPADQPTDTPAPQATNPPPTEAPPPAAPTATPAGPRLVMFYDTTSFYLHNPDAARQRVSELVFEALDENGNLSGYWFDGRRWAQFYSFVEPSGCARLEMTKVAGWLRPPQCRQYNATITPEQDGDIVFWTQRPGVAAFRVVWQGQEVGRCPINAGPCEVYLP